MKFNHYKQKNFDFSLGILHSQPQIPDDSHIDAGLGGALDRFRPLKLSECSDSTPRYYAPCQARSIKHAVVAEELIYPAFSLNAPIFATSRPHDVEKWWNSTWKLSDRAHRNGNEVRYPEKHGQLFVFENVTLSSSTPFDEWGTPACMSINVPTSFVEPSNKPPTHDTVLLANVGDSWSLQHFLDRAMRVVGQAHTFQATNIATGRKSSPSVRDMWSMLGYAPDKMIHKNTNFVASKLIWSCRAPMAHPWLIRRLISLLHPNSLSGLPVAERKTVMYMTRSNGITLNGGRKVQNEDLLLLEIRKLLDRRGEGEVLQVFNHNDFANMSTLMKYFHHNVKAIIGPHGGALHHHLWTGPDTLVVEFLPISRPDLTFFETVKLREQLYAVLMVESLDDEHNMRIEIPAVIQILEERLGKGATKNDTFRAVYDWEAEELHVV
ncbi:hypothetical protein DSL72_003886 [Monilinia vaccinii-corymbosi]|uniref:Glycosyltransferase 61 catalytic domain-containing protein n=1 Tax=Monilinia vaccinii-corymbosi TaxID=61207 RepID=A0A8A3NXY3_9HELO|nr:hypothetical protein DSL72_003886 [Monilinia vaccinii-corymbosi]